MAARQSARRLSLVTQAALTCSVLLATGFLIAAVSPAGAAGGAKIGAACLAPATAAVTVPVRATGMPGKDRYSVGPSKRLSVWPQLCGPGRTVSGRQDKRDAPTCPKGDDGYSGLMSLLSAVPEYQAFFDSLAITYVDYRAVEQSGDAITATGWPDIEAMDEQAYQRWSAGISRLKTDPLNLESEVNNATFARAMPDLFPAEESAFGGLPGVLGVDWLAVDRALSFGLDFAAQPLRWTLLGGGDDLATEELLGAALSNHGLERRVNNDIPVWHRFGDFEVKPDAEAPANFVGGRWVDPFGIRLGAATRIAVLPCMLAGSPQWQVADEIAETASGIGRSLAHNDDFRAAARAMTDEALGQGQLLQARFAGPVFSAERVSLGRLGPFSTLEQQQVLAVRIADPSRGRLPPYELVALADRRAGDEDVALVALVYRDEEAAKIAAAVLPRRLNGYVPILLRVPLVEGIDFDIRTLVFRAVDERRFVTVAVMRDIRAAGQDGEVPRKGRLHGVLHRGFLEYDADYLVPFP